MDLFQGPRWAILLLTGLITDNKTLSNLTASCALNQLCQCLVSKSILCRLFRRILRSSWVLYGVKKIITIKSLLLCTSEIQRRLLKFSQWFWTVKYVSTLLKRESKAGWLKAFFVVSYVQGWDGNPDLCWSVPSADTTLALDESARSKLGRASNTKASCVWPCECWVPASSLRRGG